MWHPAGCLLIVAPLQKIHIIEPTPLLAHGVIA
jgi:hypothetical protein